MSDHHATAGRLAKAHDALAKALLPGSGTASVAVARKRVDCTDDAFGGTRCEFP